MNNSNAAAKKRRAGIQPNMPPVPGTGGTPTPTNQSAGMTLPQVIAVIDQRLIMLETFMKESSDSEGNIAAGQDNFVEGQETGIVMDSKEFNLFVDEINNRFQTMAEEINTIKDSVLKLQGYTMDVNKVLLHEITKNEYGEMPTISLGNSENVKFILESMKMTDGGQENIDEIPNSA